jgi:hypothetical protein
MTWLVEDADGEFIISTCDRLKATERLIDNRPAGWQPAFTILRATGCDENQPPERRLRA